VTTGAIAGVVAPVLDPAPLDPVDLVDLGAGGAVVDRQVLGPFHDKSGLAAEEHVVGTGRIRRGPHTDLRLAVAVEVANDHGRPPDPHVHVPAQVDPPQEFARRAVVAVILVRAPVGTDAARVLSSAGMLDNEVIDTVAVQVADADDGHPANVVLELDRLVLLGRSVDAKLGARRGRQFRPTYDRDNPPGVRPIQGRIGVDEIRGPADRLGVQLHRLAAGAGAIDVEGNALRVGPEQSPAEIDFALAHRQGEHATVKRLLNPLRGPAQLRIRVVKRVHRVEVQVGRNLLVRQLAQSPLVVRRRARPAQAAPRRRILRPSE